MKRTWTLLIVTLAAISACQANTTSADTLRLSGVIEGTRATVMSEISARVVEVAGDEGDTVNAGQVLVKLDDTALQVQVKQAQAAVSAAEANLAQVKAGARTEEIASAQAAVAQAQAERGGAESAYKDAVTALNNPQQLQAQIDAVSTQVKLDEDNVAVAKSKLGEARWWRDFYDDDHGRHYELDRQIAIAQRELDAAQAQLDGAKAQLKALQAMRYAPVTLQVGVSSAHSTYSVTVAKVSVAETALAELKAGPTSEQVALAEAQLRQAQAQLELAQAYLSRAALRAPMTGIVSTRSTHVGETAQPGAALMTIVNLDQVTLVVYVPQESLPRVQLGAPVQVYVDAYPGETFHGQVAFIARQAQFSARDTQTREDRANVMFAVKVRLPNADHRLKAGMTADGVIELQ
jgi:HlyD family secretion protein